MGRVNRLNLRVVLLIVGLCVTAVKSSGLASTRHRRLSHRPALQFQAQTVNCDILGDGYFANEEDCQTFFFCSNGKLYPFSCPFPYKYSPERSECIWTGKLSCSESTGELPYGYGYGNVASSTVRVGHRQLHTSGHYGSQKANASLQVGGAQVPYSGGTVQKYNETYDDNEKTAEGDTEQYYSGRSQKYVAPNSPTQYSSPAVNPYVQPNVPSSNTASPSYVPTGYNQPTQAPVYKELPPILVVPPTEVQKPDPAMIQTWMTFSFFHAYTNYPVPSKADIAVGSELYNNLKDPYYQETGSSIINHNISLAKMENVVNKWYHDGLISKTEQNAQKHLLSYSKQFFITIREHVFVKTDGEIVYGITGLLQLAKKGGIRGTILNSFRKFKLKDIPVNYRSSNYTRGDECIVWGQFCKTYFVIGNLNGEDSNALVNYLRSESLKKFALDSETILGRLQIRAFNTYDDLPEVIKDSVQKVIVYAGKRRPDEIIPESQLAGDKWDL